MAESSRLNKKRKASINNDVAGQPGAAAPSLERSSDFWIDDGNVVLQTATKQYRIHRGVLSMHSSVFKDMFSIPQPAEQQTFEDAPIIEITDSADDWDALLPVIYGMKSMYESGTIVIPVSLLAAMLRLGRKYNLERFKQDALAQLERFFPDSMEEWDHLFGDSAQDLQDVMADSILQLINIALELNIRRALPFGFFTCIRERSMDEILSGVDGINGPVTLLQDTQKRLVLGKEALIRAAAKGAMSWFFSGSISSSCLYPQNCRDEIQRVVREMASGPEVGLALDPLTYNRRLDDLCSECKTEARLAHVTGREDTFRTLPSYFGLEPWDQLTNDF